MHKKGIMYVAVMDMLQYLLKKLIYFELSYMLYFVRIFEILNVHLQASFIVFSSLYIHVFLSV